jgi:hypothetical protein
MTLLPKNLRTLERDRRGYPIPYIVYRDAAGGPHFPINDATKVEEVLRKRLCALCGKRLVDGAWFIGGARCFTDPAGAFLDPPAHEECARYAIKVCPYLAARSYAKRVDDRTLNASGGVAKGAVLVVHEGTVPDDRPQTFGLGRTLGFEIIPTGIAQFVLRARGWQCTEFWRHGQRVQEGENSP